MTIHKLEIMTNRCAEWELNWQFYDNEISTFVKEPFLFYTFSAHILSFKSILFYKKNIGNKRWLFFLYFQFCSVDLKWILSKSWYLTQTLTSQIIYWILVSCLMITNVIKTTTNCIITIVKLKLKTIVIVLNHLQSNCF